MATEKPRNVGSFVELLGMKLEVDDNGHPLIRLEVTPELHNLAGVAHGGVAYSLVDTAMGAVVHWEHNPDHETFLTTDIHIRYLRTVSEGELIATGELLEKTRNTRVLSGKVVRAKDGKIVCTATASFRRLPKR